MSTKDSSSTSALKENPKLPLETPKAGKMSKELEALSQEILEAAAKKGKGEKEAKDNTILGASEIKREVLQNELGNIDIETAEKFARIDINKESREQKELFNAVQLVGHTLLSKLFDQGFTLEDFKDFSRLKEILEGTSKNREKVEKAALNGTEKVALQKLKDISIAADSKLFHELHSSEGPQASTKETFIWKNFVKNAYEVYSKAANFRDKYIPKHDSPTDQTPEWLRKKAKTVPGTLLAESAPKEKKWYESALGWLNDHKTYILLGVGAYGIYKIFLEDDSKEAAPETDSIWGKVKHHLWNNKLSLAVLVLGSLLGPKIVNSFFPEEKRERFMALINQGQYYQAIKSLTESADPNWENYKKISKTLSDEMKQEVKPENLKKISRVGYTQFLAHADAGKEIVTDGLKKSGIADAVPGGNLILDQLGGDPTQIAAEKTIREYLVKHKDQIKSGANLTVLEAISSIQQVEIIPLPVGSEKPEEGDEGYDVGNGKEPVGYSPTLFQALLKEYQDRPDKKEIYAVLKKYESKEGIINTYQCISELIDACKHDDESMIIGMGKVALYHEGKMIILSSTEHFFNAAVGVVRAVAGDASGWIPVKEYTYGAAPCIVVGAALNTVFGSGKGGPVIRFISGGVKGAFFPISATAWATPRIYRGSVQGYRTVKETSFSLQKLFTKDHATILESEARFHAEISHGYKELKDARLTGRTLDVKKWWAKVDAKRIEALHLEHLNKFARAYNELHPADTKLVADHTNPAAVERVEQAVDDFIKEQKALGKISSEVAKHPINEPELLESDKVISPDQKHRYRFFEEEINLTQKDIEAKAKELGDADSKKPERKGYRSDGEFDEKFKVWEKSNITKAVKDLCKERLYTPIEVAGEPNTYRYQGQKVTFTEIEITQVLAETDPLTSKNFTRAEAIGELCRRKVLNHLEIVDVRRDFRTGKYEYKIGDKWIETEKPLEPAKSMEIKETFEKTLKDKGIIINFEKDIAKSKYLKCWEFFEKIMGPVAAVLIIYELETTPDKRKAASKVIAGLASFMAGEKGAVMFLQRAASIASKFQKGAEIGNKIAPAGPIGKFLMIAAGIGAAIGLHEPVSELVEGTIKMFFGPASHGVSKELGEIMKEMSYASLGRSVLRSAEKGLLKKVLEKQAVKTVLAKPAVRAIEKFMVEKIGNVFLKRVMRFAARTGFTNILKTLGWRGAATAVLLADDATIIGVLDDVIALGLVIWMGKDIYDIVQLMRNAYKVKDEMEKRADQKIIKIQGGDPKSNGLLQGELTKLGLTIDRIGELDKDQVEAIFHSFPNETIIIEIEREGILDPKKESANAEKKEVEDPEKKTKDSKKTIINREKWIIKNGEAVGITIYADGKEYASITDEDAADMEKALDSMEKEDNKKKKESEDETPAPSPTSTPPSKVIDLPPPREPLAEAA